MTPATDEALINELITSVMAIDALSGPKRYGKRSVMERFSAAKAALTQRLSDQSTELASLRTEVANLKGLREVDKKLNITLGKMGEVDLDGRLKAEAELWVARGLLGAVAIHFNREQQAVYRKFLSHQEVQ